MVIVHIIFSFLRGGTESMLVDILNEQVKTEKVSLIIINNLFNQELLNSIHKDIRIIRLNRIPGSHDIFAFIKLYYYLLKISPQIIHCHDVNIVKMLFFTKAKLCFTLHNVQSKLSDIKKYDKVFAVSNAVKEYIKEQAGIEAQVIYNGIFPDFIEKRKSPPGAPFRVIQIGRLDKDIKGQDLLIQAVSEVIKKGHDIELYIVGNGKSYDYLKKITDKLGIEQKIFFLGEKSRNEIYTNLHKYDLLVQPSLFEGFGLTIIEAMAAHVPVLVSNLAGPMEVINEGECGDYFEAGNLADLTAKIENIINNPLTDNIKIKKASERVNTYFNISHSAQCYLNSYNDLIR
ncbi:glycosyltransferase [Bacteroides nordii]|uniref:glycosyltransferase n=1 Tax=Bacteroides nordii TaxID=291645 RepID=UPI002A83AE0C|nr:glycosyltransferase [Bacteroides nordii]